VVPSVGVRAAEDVHVPHLGEHAIQVLWIATVCTTIREWICRRGLLKPALARKIDTPRGAPTGGGRPKNPRRLSPKANSAIFVSLEKKAVVAK